MIKNRLFTPGPTMVPPEVLEAMSRPIIHHRKAEFKSILEEAREGLKYVFQTKEEVIILTSSGTGAMEAAICNLFSKGDKVIAVNGGKFGERWVELGNVYGLDVIPFNVTWGEAADPDVLISMLESEKDIKGVLIQASETSTGVKHPVKEIAEYTRKRDDVVLVVDGITAVGVFDIPMDGWGIDVLITGSQKALMTPPGLAFIALNEKAWNFVDRSDLPKYYFDLKKAKKEASKNQTPYTPAISLIIGLNEAIKIIKNEGLENVFKRHERYSRATIESFKAMGLEIFPRVPSPALTAVKIPDGMDGEAFVKDLQTEFGAIVAGGQSQLKGKIFRVSHMGYVDPLDILSVISAVEVLLKKKGRLETLGRAVSLAESILWEV